MMESIYYAVSWLCHRQCPHCYEERFHPYHGSELAAVVQEGRSNFARIIENFPPHMRYRVPEDTRPDGVVPEKIGRIILAGGEVLLPQVRESVLYRAMDLITEKYVNAGGVKVVVQTTGDLVTPKIVDELLQHGAWMISVSGMDDFHEGMDEEQRRELTGKLTQMFEGAGMHRSGLKAGERKWHEEAGPVFSFFGATPDAWIGKIWPRGRAWSNGLSRATLGDNFCNAWSGGLNFLNIGEAGSEVSIEPNGNVYPCCMKTRVPIGNLIEESLMDIVQSLVGHPAYEAISMGHPERMGISYGWSPSHFFERSRTITPSGRPYQNLCLGCDQFHEKVLGPVIKQLREARLAKRGSATPANR
jgi:hypothetical protein